MKKVLSRSFFLSLFMLMSSMNVSGQNVQLHYDMGRSYLTSTVEMFKPDAGGSTFFFIDLNYDPRVTGAYFEISRELCFWQESKADWLSLHLEYNGGLDTANGSYNNMFELFSPEDYEGENSSNSQSIALLISLSLNIGIHLTFP